MPDVTIHVPDSVVTDYIDMQDEIWDYEANKLDEETRAQFAERMLKQAEGKRLHEYRTDKFNADYNAQNKAWQDQWETENLPPDEVEIL